ncbi:helix-turn-helix domain-containing protein [Streptomyces sp. NPDC050560]|uniref:helix-turn-helix domain-containing protein n=1 Tax=Streptomyces sp. NPDC050560 TaxID=3365630 RepID=UPI0037945636
MPPNRHRRLPTKLAALALGVSEATIRQWARRGKLTRYGSPGRAIYDVDELANLAERRDH